MLLKWTYLSLAILITLSFNTNAKSEKTLNTQFKAAYYSYQGAIKSNDEDAQFKYAKEAYQLGNKFYGETNINTANLALILAQQHLNKKQKKQVKMNHKNVPLKSTFHRYHHLCFQLRKDKLPLLIHTTYKAPINFPM